MGLDTIQPVSGWWMYEIIGDSSSTATKQRSRKDSKADVGWPAKRFQPLVYGDA